MIIMPILLMLRSWIISDQRGWFVIMVLFVIS